MPELIRIPDGELEPLLSRALTARGTPADRADLTARIVADNQREGVHSHGLNRFPALVRGIAAGHVDPRADPARVAGTAALEQWDGALGLGPWNATQAMHRALTLAGQHGIGAVGLRRTNHWLRAGTYALQAAAAGRIGICWTNTMPLMPPWGGCTPRLGNNPLAIALPSSGEPLLVDLALSQFSNGRLEVLRRRGETLPVVGGLDAAGQPSRDPGAILASRRPLPIGHWKGSALAVALDALAAVISGGQSTHEIGRQATEQGVSQVFLALQPGHGAAAMVGAILDDLRASPPADPAAPVRAPGDARRARREECTRLGVPVDAAIWAEISTL